MPSSPINIAKLNIEHFKERLRHETDDAKRQTIAKLLAEEETKLARLLQQQKR